MSGTLPFASESPDNYDRLTYVLDGKTDVVERELISPWRVYLKRSTGRADISKAAHQSFLKTKIDPHESWAWTDSARELCPYTVECVESLPFRSFGTVYAFIMENSFLPTHRDFAWDPNNPNPTGYDRSKSLGFSLVPETGGMGTQLWHPNEKRVHEVHGHATLFDDAMWHGTRLPDPGSRRVIVRVFGDMEWDAITQRIVPGTAVHL